MAQKTIYLKPRTARLLLALQAFWGCSQSEVIARALELVHEQLNVEAARHQPGMRWGLKGYDTQKETNRD